MVNIGPVGPQSPRKKWKKSRLKKKLQTQISPPRWWDGILRYITKLLTKIFPTTWHNFFRAKSKKIFDFFFASHTQTVLKNTQHGPKNLNFCFNMPNYCADFLGPFPIFQLTWKNSNSKKCTKKSEKNVPKPSGPTFQWPIYPRRWFTKNTKTNSTDVRRMGLCNGKNRIILRCFATEKSEFYGTPSQRINFFFEYTIIY